MADAVADARRLDAYAEMRTKEMHVCAFCETIGYRRHPMRPLGKRWICIDCARQLKEVVEQLDQWAEEAHLREQIQNQLGQGIGGSDATSKPS